MRIVDSQKNASLEDISTKNKEVDANGYQQYRTLKKEIESIKETSTRSTHRMDAFFKHNYTKNCTGSNKRIVQVKNGTERQPQKNDIDDMHYSIFTSHDRMNSTDERNRNGKDQILQSDQNKLGYITTHSQKKTKSQILKMLLRQPHNMSWIKEKKRNQEMLKEKKRLVEEDLKQREKAIL